MKKLIVIAAVLLSACASAPRTPSVERMYVIDCGENHVSDLSRWTPGVNVGKAHVFANHCCLIRHAQGWMLWDTGNSDSLAARPDGLSVAGGTITVFDKLRSNQTMTLGGDYDVFGDGSVMILRAPGHTPGHQVLVVRLPRTGRVMLSGDMVHLNYSWTYGVVPSFNFDVPGSMATIAAMKDYVAKSGAQLWVNHDLEQHAKIPKAPKFVE